MRLFAMVDPFTQWSLRPLHRWLFAQLRKHPSVDGTFNQGGPLKRVPFLLRPVYSFDLSSATDRLPVSLQAKLLSHVFGTQFARLWRLLLTERSYFLKDPFTKETSIVKYSVGQPMGALSSWAMLALTHHFIVQVAAWKSGKTHRRLFVDYAVLGDDICIWDKSVAREYLKVMKALGVQVGLAKSVISPLGLSLEFAKKTLYRGQDVSPVPLKEYSAALEKSASLSHFAKKYHLSDSTIKRLIGLGYKSSEKSARWQMWKLVSHFPGGWTDLRKLFSFEFGHLMFKFGGDNLEQWMRSTSREISQWRKILSTYSRLCSVLKDRALSLYSKAAQHVASAGLPWAS
jgi:hypothetical protein